MNGAGTNGSWPTCPKPTQCCWNGNTTLTTLNLISTNIGYDGAVAIADALQNGQTTLTTLVLTSNNIGDVGSAAVADALRNGNTTLATLVLDNNIIGKDGAVAIADALRNGNTTLLELDLTGNECMTLIGIDHTGNETTLAFNDVVEGIEALLSQRWERMSANMETVPQQINQAVAKRDAEPRRRERIAGDMETVLQQINQAVAKRDAEPVEIQSPVFFEAALRRPHALLGTGTFGAAYLIVDPALFFGRPFAVKRFILDLDDQQRQVAWGTFRTEIQVLQRFRHPSLARLWGYHLSTLLPPKNCVHYLLYEYAARGSLEGLLITLEGRQQLNFPRRLHILLDVAQGLHFLHKGAATATAAKGELSSSSSNVDYTFCHCDVKSANVCITADYRAKIIDCGLDKLLPKDEEAESKLSASWARSTARLSSGGGDKLGTPAYRDPGYEHGVYRYGTWCDIFSYGVVMAELITGTLSSSSSTASATVAAATSTSTEASRGGTVHRKYVYPGKTKRDLRGDVDDVTLDAPGASLQALCHLCLQCLDDDAWDRPDAFAVLDKLQRLSVQVVYGVAVAVVDKVKAGKDCCCCSLCGRNDRGPTAGLSCGDHFICGDHLSTHPGVESGAARMRRGGL